MSFSSSSSSIVASVEDLDATMVGGSVPRSTTGTFSNAAFSSAERDAIRVVSDSRWQGEGNESEIIIVVVVVAVAVVCRSVVSSVVDFSSHVVWQSNDVWFPPANSSLQSPPS